MARYYFNIYDGQTPADDDGTELPDVYTARKEAIRLCGEILREVRCSFDSESDWRLEVTDDHDNRLFILRFSVDTPGATPPTS